MAASTSAPHIVGSTSCTALDLVEGSTARLAVTGQLGPVDSPHAEAARPYGSHAYLLGYGQLEAKATSMSASRRRSDCTARPRLRACYGQAFRRPASCALVCGAWAGQTTPPVSPGRNGASRTGCLDPAPDSREGGWTRESLT
jgi:hypothetical protein